jgi:uncharacterized protein
MRSFDTIKEFITNKLKCELAPALCFHNVEHTSDVLRAAELIAADEKIGEHDLFLLKIAVLYHDAGFMEVYGGHEKVSCQMARTDLPHFGLSADEIEIICDIIMATKIPHQPKTQLEKIIADADLSYLGTNEYKRISNNLFEEIKFYINNLSQREWDEMQVDFFNNHHYFTNFCIINRAPKMNEHLIEIKARLQ